VEKTRIDNLLLSGNQQGNSSDMLNVMTFNIRYGLAEDGENHWNKRKGLVIERIQAFDPDLLGIQECRDDEQAEFIRSSLPEHHFFGVRRASNDSTALEMAPILFRKSCFEPIQSGCFWLSQTPDVAGSKSWDSTFARTATWAELCHTPSGKTLVFLNTHFDYRPRAIDGAARLLLDWANQTLARNPLIITGDFNADKHSSAYQLLTGTLTDVHRQAHPDSRNEATYHDFGRASPPTPIDWILTSTHFTILEATIDSTHPEGRYPSDHYPVTGVLGL
jgi:endonuclease/exonuclease/phosphatase family metal-dependent hydrolase